MGKVGKPVRYALVGVLLGLVYGVFKLDADVALARNIGRLVGTALVPGLIGLAVGVFANRPRGPRIEG